MTMARVIVQAYRMKAHRCLRCDELLDAATPIPGSEHNRPARGDVSICWKCNHVAIFTRGSKLREPRPDELRAIMADPRVSKTRNAWNLLHVDKKRRN
jgi:hypothetical protein